MQFLDLPTELLIEIGESCDTVSDICRLSETSRVMHFIMVHLIDKAIRMHGRSRLLLEAATKGNEPFARKLITMGADVNSTIKGYDSILNTKDESSILQHACHGGHAGMVRILLANGARTDIVRNKKDSLCYAILSGSLEVVQILINHGARINAEDKRGAKALHHCAFARSGREIAEFLISRGADINARDNYHQTPLHYAAIEQNIDVLMVLLVRGARMNALDRRGHTALKEACLENKPSSVQALLRAGADPNFRHHASALELSSIKNNDIKVMLLDNGLDPNLRGLCDTTPLHDAASDGNERLVRKLVEVGADISAEDKDGHTPLWYAVTTEYDQNIKVFDFLLKKSGPLSRKELLELLLAAVREAFVAAVELLLESGVDPNEENKFSPLHQAAEEGYTSILMLLINHGATVSAPDSGGHTPLHFAAEHDKVEVATCLLDHGAEIDARSMRGDTPLHHAARNYNHDVFKLLVDRGADVQARNDSDWTILHKAAESGSSSMVEAVLSLGVKDDTLNLEGESAYDLAVENGNPSAYGTLVCNEATLIKKRENVARFYGDIFDEDID